VLASRFLSRGIASEDFNHQSGTAFGGPALCLVLLHCPPPRRQKNLPVRWTIGGLLLKGSRIFRQKQLFTKIRQNRIFLTAMIANGKFIKELYLISHLQNFLNPFLSGLIF
jgi:hypothetical protein